MFDFDKQQVDYQRQALLGYLVENIADKDQREQVIELVLAYGNSCHDYGVKSAAERVRNVEGEIRYDTWVKKHA